MDTAEFIKKYYPGAAAPSTPRRPGSEYQTSIESWHLYGNGGVMRCGHPVLSIQAGSYSEPFGIVEGAEAASVQAFFWAVHAIRSIVFAFKSDDWADPFYKQFAGTKDVWMTIRTSGIVGGYSARNGYNDLALNKVTILNPVVSYSGMTVVRVDCPDMVRLVATP